MNYCLWASSITAVKDIHGDDILADWQGRTFSVGDLIFIGTPTDISIYMLSEFSEVTQEDLPYTFQGNPNGALGTPIFTRLALSYSNTMSYVIGTGTGWYCDNNERTEAICALLRNVDKFPDLQFHPMETSEVPAPPVSGDPRLLQDTTETQWIEEAGALLDWISDRLTFSGTSGGGGGTPTIEYDQTTYIITGGAYPHTRNVELLSSKTGIAHGTIKLNGSDYYMSANTRVWHSENAIVSDTSLSVNVGPDFDGGPFHNDSPYRTEIVYPSGGTTEWYIMAYASYTNSKPGQGACVAFCINADGTFNDTYNHKIDGPAINRYSEFGICVGGVYRSDGSKDLIISETRETCWYHYNCTTTTVDYVQTHLAIVDHVPVMVVSDPMMADHCLIIEFDGTHYDIALYKFTGTTISLVGSMISAPWPNHTSNFEVLYFDEANATVWLATLMNGLDGDVGVYEIDLGPTTRIYLHQILAGPSPTPDAQWDYESLSNIHKGQFMYLSLTQTDAGKRQVIRQIEITGINPPVLSVVMDFEKTDIPDCPAYDREARPSVIERSTVDPTSLDGLVLYDYYSSATLGTGYFFDLVEGGGTVFDTGHYHVSTNDDASRLIVPAGAIEITSASVTATPQTGGEIRFAFSVDGGANWQTWGGSGNVALTSLADIEVNGSDYTNFGNSLTALDVSVDKTIDIAFALNRPAAAMADDIAPYIESYTYATSTGESVVTVATGIDCVLNSTFTNDPPYATADGDFVLALHDTLKDLD